VGHEATQDGNEDIRKDLLEDHASCPDMQKERRIAFGSTHQETQRVSGISGTDALVAVKI